ncbi:partial tricorn protease, partial [Planctomycetaceae bacterium]
MARAILYACGVLAAIAFLSQPRFSQDEPTAGRYAYTVAPQVFRSPALSPDGKQLAFVYDGDIWSVASDGGVARRLTITVDNDGSPCFSPDGKLLAFRSRRYGSDDIFVMPAGGGEARRLTFSDGAEDPCCWLPDSSGVVFSASRDLGRDLWVVRTDASEPWPISGGGFGESESNATISHDGKHIAYVRGGGDAMRRRGYFGTASSDIWLCDFDGLTTKNHRALSAARSHEDWPCFADNNTVVFVNCAASKSKSTRVGRLAAVSLDGADVKGWGGETELDARELSIGGGKLAFATGNYGGWRLHVGEFGKRPPVKLNTPEIRIDSDVRTAAVKSMRLTGASEFKVSPDGKKLAFVAGGDVFLLPTEEGGVPRQLTDTVEREKDVDWDSDSRTLCYSSRRGGAWRVYGVDAATGKEVFVRSQGVQVSRPQFLLGGKRLAYVLDESQIHVELPDGKALDLKGYFTGANMSGGDYFDVSPDGQWMLFEQPNEIYDDTLFVANLASGEIRALTRMFGGCNTASFTRDGKRVVFSCDQEGNNDIYVIDLVAQPVEFKEDKLDKLFKEPPKTGAAPDEKKEEPKAEEPKPDDPKKEEPKKEEPTKPAAKKPPETKINFDGIERRTRRITSLEGEEFYPVCLDDGKTFYFLAAVQGQSNLWKLTLDPDKGPDLKQVTQSRTQKSRLKLSPDEKSLWFLDGGTITNFQLQSGKITAYAFSVEQRRDARELRAETLSEAR